VAAIAVVPAADRIGRSLRASGSGDPKIVAAALASAAAASIHFSVAKMHFEEYALFGVFFVLSGIAQLVWPVWLLLRRWQPLLVLGAIGNTLIVALWAVDRLWGLPLGPEPWRPEPFAFADTVASACEVGLVGCCVLLLARGHSSRKLRTRTVVAAAIGVAAVTALAFLSVLGVASSLLTPET
jgi:hypothetical protein